MTYPDVMRAPTVIIENLDQSYTLRISFDNLTVPHLPGRSACRPHKKQGSRLVRAAANTLISPTISWAHTSTRNGSTAKLRVETQVHLLSHANHVTLTLNEYSKHSLSRYNISPPKAKFSYTCEWYGTYLLISSESLYPTYGWFLLLSLPSLYR